MLEILNLAISVALLRLAAANVQTAPMRIDDADYEIIPGGELP